MKTIDDHFRDWEHNTFGFGYGTGEEYIIPSLREFLSLCKVRHDRGSFVYDYNELENALTPATAWLLINTLARHGIDIIEYGTSPRYAWLTDEGKRLREYMLSKDSDELYNIATGDDEDYMHCYPDYCNCDGDACHNPFWVNKKDKGRATYYD